MALRQRAQESHSATGEQPLARFTVPSQPGGEREAAGRVMGATADLPIPQDRRGWLEIAVAEAVMNAMEHGSDYAADKPVHVEVTTDGGRLRLAITDQGGGMGYLDTAEEPDIHAKLRDGQSPRGWGLFLVRSLVDEVHETVAADHHTLTLELQLGERHNTRPPQEQR